MLPTSYDNEAPPISESHSPGVISVNPDFLHGGTLPRAYVYLFSRKEADGPPCAGDLHFYESMILRVTAVACGLWRVCDFNPDFNRVHKNNLLGKLSGLYDSIFLIREGEGLAPFPLFRLRPFRLGGNLALALSFLHHYAMACTRIARQFKDAKPCGPAHEIGDQFGA